MRKVDDGEKKKKKRMTFLVATTSLPAVYRPNSYARTTTAGTPHARAKSDNIMYTAVQVMGEKISQSIGICLYFLDRFGEDHHLMELIELQNSYICFA